MSIIYARVSNWDPREVWLHVNEDFSSATDPAFIRYKSRGAARQARRDFEREIKKLKTEEQVWDWIYHSIEKRQ